MFKGTMRSYFASLTASQKVLAMRRLTALWAFSESGLGGILHAFQLPVTGLIVGGISVMMISFIALLSANNYKEIFTSLIIVLIIKAGVSPYTPVTAYIAVTFQAVAGYLFFRSFGINFGSIFLVGIITMLESALQHLLVLTFIFGQSFWKALDAFTAFVGRQFDTKFANGSQWLLGAYLGIYLFTGMWIAWLTWRIMNDRNSFESDVDTTVEVPLIINDKKRSSRKLWIMLATLVVISVILFFLPKEGSWLPVVKALCWTLSVITIWFMLINPLLIKLIKQFLAGKEKAYNEEVSQTLAFLPVMRQLTFTAWQKSKEQKSGARWYVFMNTLIHWTLIYSDDKNIHKAGQKRKNY